VIITDESVFKDNSTSCLQIAVLFLVFDIFQTCRKQFSTIPLMGGPLSQRHQRGHHLVLHSNQSMVAQNQLLVKIKGHIN
jgi:hypothetical protein